MGMLALIYLALAICVGDFFCRRFYRFVSVAHRCAAALLVGLLISSWFTYLAGLAFAWTARPLLWANLLFFLAALALLSWPKWEHRIVKAAPDAAHSSETAETYVPRPNGSGIADWLVIAGYVVLVSWMMFASFHSSDGKLQISNPEYSDFGPNTAIMQSFAVGHNFPTEYPHFSGDRIRYHFLFYFQAGNLEFIGLNQTWGTWSQVTYLNQRHFASAIGILLLVLTFLVIRYRMRPKKRAKTPPSPEPVAAQPGPSPEFAADTGSENPTQSEIVSQPTGDIT